MPPKTNQTEQLTLEQLALAEQLQNPDLLAQQQFAENPVSQSQPNIYQIEAPKPVHTPEQTRLETRWAAKELLQHAGIEALENAKGTSNGAQRTEQAMKNEKLVEAEHEIDTIFGGSDARQIKTGILERALEHEHVGGHSQNTLAAAMVEGHHPAEKLGSEPLAPNIDPGSEAAIQLAGIRDRNNGATPKIMSRLAKKAEHQLEHLGVRSLASRRAEKQELVGELAETVSIDQARGAKEEDITNAPKAARAVNEVVGRKLIEAIGSPRRMSGSARRHLRDVIKDDPSVAKVLAPAVARQRSSGAVSRLSARRVGAVLNHSKAA